MYMQLTWAKLTKADNWPQIEEIYRARGHVETPGLLSRWVARDSEDPESFFGLTLWADLDSTRAWDASPEREKFDRWLTPWNGSQPSSGTASDIGTIPTRQTKAPTSDINRGTRNGSMRQISSSSGMPATNATTI